MSTDVSVIIAAYNVKNYIRNAIASALSQESVNVEVIVVDDCSTDETWQIVSEMKDPRIKCFRLSRNSGPGAARNEAIAEATGKWLAILDGDDQFLPGRLTRCIKQAEALQADIVVDNLYVRREKDSMEFPMFSPAPFSFLKYLDLATFIDGKLPGSGNYNLGYLKPVFSAKFLRRYSLSYDPELKIGEDYVLMAEALARGARCIVEPSAGYLYTARSTSISYRLSVEDIARMQAADVKFVSRYTLDPSAAKAQRKRELSLKREYAYTQLVAAIKQKDTATIFRTAIFHPLSAWLLYRSVWVRIQRLYKVLGV